MVKLLLAGIILGLMVRQDIRNRSISDKTWISLLALGLIGFIYNLSNNPMQTEASRFAFGLASGLLLASPFFIINKMYVGNDSSDNVPMGNGDGLAIVALSTVVYDLEPFPLITWILLFGFGIALVWGLLQEKYGSGCDVPLTAPITIGFILSLVVF